MSLVVPYLLRPAAIGEQHSKRLMIPIIFALEDHRHGFEIAASWRSIQLFVECLQCRRSLRHRSAGTLRSVGGRAAKSSGAGSNSKSQQRGAAVRIVRHGQVSLDGMIGSLHRLSVTALNDQERLR